MLIIHITSSNKAPSQTINLDSLFITWKMIFFSLVYIHSLMRSRTILLMSMELRILGKWSVVTLR